MYRKGWPPNGEIVSGGAIQLGGIIHPADVHLLEGWIADDRVTAVHMDDVIEIRDTAVAPFVRVVRALHLTVYGSEGSRVFGDLERGGLERGRELIGHVAAAR
jgi:hypothetical protein